MDILDEEVIRLWTSLKAHQVEYLMVGGFATNLHGFSRTTGDIDLWIKDGSENRKRLVYALLEIGVAGAEVLKDSQLIPGWTSVTLPSGLELDLMTFIGGFEATDFDACLSLASEAEIENLKIPFLHLNDLIRSKEQTNRPKDQIDLLELKRIRNNRS